MKTTATPSMIVREALRQLKNNLSRKQYSAIENWRKHFSVDSWFGSSETFDEISERCLKPVCLLLAECCEREKISAFAKLDIDSNQPSVMAFATDESNVFIRFSVKKYDMRKDRFVFSLDVGVA